MALPTFRSPTGPRELNHRSLWLQQALPDEGAELSERKQLGGRTSAGVCILGGGYTGLWTALFLKEQEPGLDIAIVEADICGGGASGRNGGFVLPWWSKLGSLIKLCGEDDGLWLAEQSEKSVRDVGQFCKENKIEADFMDGGWLWVATSEIQVDTWEPTVAELEERGIDHVFERVGVEEAQASGGSRAYLGGVRDRITAQVNPGRLVRGLRRVAIERGIRIYEDSPVLAVEGQSPLIVKTDGGEVESETVVAALNAWSTGLAQLRSLGRAFVPVVSDIVATAPAPNLLEQIGWTGGECVSDSRLLVHYHRTTADGRIAFGRGGGAIGAFGYFGENFHYDRRRSEGVAASLRWLYPEFENVEITHAWAGPVDRSETGLPFFGRVEGQEKLIYGLGFSGNGVGPCVTGGRILAAMALGADDRWSNTALSSGPASLFPPEPIRYLGGRLVREAVARKESADDAGREPSLFARTLSQFAPAGFFRVGEKKPSVAQPAPAERERAEPRV